MMVIGHSNLVLFIITFLFFLSANPVGIMIANILSPHLVETVKSIPFLVGENYTLYFLFNVTQNL